MKQALNLHDRLDFGTHRGETIQEIIDDNPTYLEWAQDEIEEFELSTEAQDALDKVLGLEDKLEGLF